MLSPPFSINLSNLRRSHDIDVVDLYSDLAISLALTGNVGGLKGYIGIGNKIGELGTVGGEMQLVKLEVLMLESAR